MSKEFFDAMEEISKKATKIKFLEGSYPEIYGRYFPTAERIKDEINKMEASIVNELKKKIKVQRPKTNKK